MSDDKKTHFGLTLEEDGIEVTEIYGKAQTDVKRVDISPRGDWWQAHESVDGTFVYFSDHSTAVEWHLDTIAMLRTQLIGKDLIIAARDRQIEELEGKREHAGKANAQAWDEIRQKDMQLAEARKEIEQIRNVLSAPQMQYETVIDDLRKEIELTAEAGRNLITRANRQRNEVEDELAVARSVVANSLDAMKKTRRTLEEMKEAGFGTGAPDSLVTAIEAAEELV